MVRSRFLSAVFMLCAATALTSCAQKELDDFAYKSKNAVTQDRDLDYNRDDYRRAMAPRPVDPMFKKSNNASVPDLAPVMAEDKKNILPQPLVSITVNQDVPLRDIFFELAKQAEVDLELDPTITGSIIFTAYNRPFDQVVERISEMAGLRYKFKNNILRVERDTPYHKAYRIDYLNTVRNYTSTITSNNSAATSGSGGGGGGGGGSNGSSSTITSNSTADFWNDLERNLTQIIQVTNQQVALTNQATPNVSTPNAIPAVSADQLTAINNAAGTPGAPAPADATAAGATSSSVPTVVINTGASGPAVAGLLNPTGTQSAVSGGGAAGAPAGGASGGSQNANPYFSVNKAAGILNIFATERQHEKISAYLQELRRSINSQVLIEAKVFEVELNDESTTGIDWAAVSDNANVIGGVSLDRLSFPSDPALASNGGVFQYTSDNFNILIDLLQRFGTLRTLSSPRLTVMNNQTAVLNVSESRVFFEIEIQRTEGTANNPPRTDISSEIKNVPEGLIISVQPSIEPDSKEITMNLRPSITRITRFVSDPGARIASGGTVENLVPELSVREIDSIVKMRSGTTIVMGGLMQDRAESRQQGVPVLGETPLIGPLFRNQRDQVRKTEMIIMLRATVSEQPQPDETDKDMYKKMAGDRHPLDL